MSSFAFQIKSLEIGDCVSRSRRLHASIRIGDEIAMAVSELRSSIDPQVSKLRKATGRDFIVENGHYLSNGNAFIVSVAVTRIH